jgi:cytochrome c556
MPNHCRSLSWISSALILSCTLASQSWAAPKPEVVAKMRQGFMQTQKYQVSHLGAVSKGNVEFSDETVQRAQNLANLAQIIPDVFSVRSDKDTVDFANALPKAWDDAEGRNKLIKRLQSETARLAQIAEQRDEKALSAQFKRVTKVCKDCHDNYKKPNKK